MKAARFINILKYNIKSYLRPDGLMLIDLIDAISDLAYRIFERKYGTLPRMRYVLEKIKGNSQ